MELFKQILASFEGTIPKDSKTYAAIARGAGPEEISASATEEGLHALAGALFEACEESIERDDASPPLGDALDARLREFRQQLPPACETARLIDAGAPLEEISEAAEAEGLHSLAAMLAEVEQERGTD
jgi:hypothetical protein